MKTPTVQFAYGKKVVFKGREVLFLGPDTPKAKRVRICLLTKVTSEQLSEWKPKEDGTFVFRPGFLVSPTEISPVGVST